MRTSKKINKISKRIEELQNALVEANLTRNKLDETIHVIHIRIEKLQEDLVILQEKKMKDGVKYEKNK